MTGLGISILAVFSLTASNAFAGGIDGKWKGEMKQKAKGGEERTVGALFNLKAEGSTLKGTVALANKTKRSRVADVTDGKLEGNKFSFTTVMKTKRKEVTLRWEGTVTGDEIQVSQTGKGRKRARGSMTLKRVEAAKAEPA